MMNQHAPQQQAVPARAGAAPARARQFTAISRERFANKKWRRPNGYGHAATDTMAPIVARELGKAALGLPLAFLQQGDRLILAAVLSVTPGRNMLVAPDGRWLGSYIPASIRAYPFALAQHSVSVQATLCIDMASGLVVEGSEPGEDFFDREGNPSAATQQMLDVLIGLERSRKVTNAAIAALTDAGVIQPWPIKRKTPEGEKTIAGLNRIDEPALHALVDDAFLKLHKATSALPIAYAQLISMGQIGLFAQLDRLQAQLRPQTTSSLIAALPENLDSLFGTTSDDIIQFP
jgi:hypothetical protein